MLQSIELQVISRILTSEDDEEIETLCSYDSSYYSTYKDQIEFILDHKYKYGNVPDTFTFQAQFADLGIEIVDVHESTEYLEDGLRTNKQYIIFLETFNKVKDLMQGDIKDTWKYIGLQLDKATSLDNDNQPLDLIHDAKKRAEWIIESNKHPRIPTGFAEIDKILYGGLSTVEELLLVLARTNTGKSWVCTKMMESAQKNGFPVAYYSPEMQGAFLGTRFDTWRNHFKNSDLFRGAYTAEYWKYLEDLSTEETPAYIIEDKDLLDGVTARKLEPFIKKYGIKLLIIDGLSYMSDDQQSTRDVEKYKHICLELFSISKKYGCAVVVSVQANRATKEQKDDKGDPFPNIYNIEGSDHPARIATEVFSLRQVFDTHVLDIRLEKARMAAKTSTIFSYSWDINNGNCQFLPSEETLANNLTLPTVSPTIVVPTADGGTTEIKPANEIPSENKAKVTIDDLNDSNESVEF